MFRYIAPQHNYFNTFFSMVNSIHNTWKTSQEKNIQIARPEGRDYHSSWSSTVGTLELHSSIFSLILS